MTIVDESTESAPRRVVGLDLGKQRDPTALALLEWFAPGSLSDEAPKRPEYNIRTLKRWPLATPYMAIVAQVVRFFEAPELCGATLVVDATGVGNAVAESVEHALRSSQNATPACVVAVTITAGHEATFVGPGRWHVPKKDLVSVLQVLLGNRRLHIAPGLAERKTLAHELANFKIKVTQSGNDQYEAWRSNEHDDMVLAVALACWSAEMMMRSAAALRIHGPLICSGGEPPSASAAPASAQSSGRHAYEGSVAETYARVSREMDDEMDAEDNRQTGWWNR